MKSFFGLRNNNDKKEINLNLTKIPKHIAIIMDGNGRWAKEKNLPRAFGHKAGVETIRDIVKECSSLGVKYLTLYAFSTENWKRPADEVNMLMKLLVEYLKKEINELHKEKVVVKSIGDISKLPKVCQDELYAAYELTKKNNGLTLNLALNYGGRDEIVNSVIQIADKVKRGELRIEEINENNIKENLYTGNIPDPDIIIRTAGEQRLSNFLLWQCAYSEFWYTDIKWPNFKREDLRKAIYDYQNRERRYGGIK